MSGVNEEIANEDVNSIDYPLHHQTMHRMTELIHILKVHILMIDTYACNYRASKEEIMTI
jgi:hypothetical protein